jgi:hypothetical protein
VKRYKVVFISSLFSDGNEELKWRLKEKIWRRGRYRDGIFKLLRSPGFIPRNRFHQHSPIPTWFLAPIDCSKIPAQIAAGEVKEFLVLQCVVTVSTCNID